MTSSKRHIELVKRYQKRVGKQYHLWMHTINDADIIKRLESVDNKQGYIKSLIRADIAKGGTDGTETRPAKP